MNGVDEVRRGLGDDQYGKSFSWTCSCGAKGVELNSRAARRASRVHAAEVHGFQYPSWWNENRWWVMRALFFVDGVLVGIVLVKRGLIR